MVELRWVNKDVNGDVTVHGRPTATDALEYANNRLEEAAEFDCCKTDMRLSSMELVEKLLTTYKEAQK